MRQPLDSSRTVHHHVGVDDCVVVIGIGTDKKMDSDQLKITCLFSDLLVV